jgi:hypothetical protein
VSNEPITTAEQAKKFFVSMGCSGFHMFREYPERYEEYKKLAISEYQENEWRLEQIDAYLRDIMVTKNNSELWYMHSEMAELVEVVKTSEALEKMLMATHHMRDTVPFEDRVIVAETINGRRDRKYRSGLIYLAYDLQSPSIAKGFVELSLYFSNNVEGMTSDFTRCQNATQTCNEIVVELGL